MADDGKKVYKKPAASDVGRSASVLGAGCSPGINQSSEPTCETTGSTADGVCATNGEVAGVGRFGGNCYQDGQTATAGICSRSGLTAGFYQT